MSIADEIATPPWNQIDTVLLDMDGTLLDLHFDNFFWLELVPRRYAHDRHMRLEDALATLGPKFAAKQGTLDWYCTDYWSRELDLDIAGLKREMRERVAYLPGAEVFLQEMMKRGKRTVLVTNAHPDSLAVKVAQTGFDRYFATMISSHSLGAPKEDDAFWDRLQPQIAYDPARTLFVDDSASVLRAAQRRGVVHLFTILRPDSTQDARPRGEFAAVERIIELIAR